MISFFALLGIVAIVGAILTVATARDFLTTDDADVRNSSAFVIKVGVGMIVVALAVGLVCWWVKSSIL